MAREMSTVESAWVGALIEGEGCLVFREVPGGIDPRITVGSQEIETIATLLRLTGSGRVKYSKESGAKKNPIWFWDIYRQKDIIKVLGQILPFLTGKRDRAVAVLERLS